MRAGSRGREKEPPSWEKEPPLPIFLQCPFTAHSLFAIYVSYMRKLHYAFCLFIDLFLDLETG